MRLFWRFVGKKLLKHCPDMFNVSVDINNVEVGDDCKDIKVQAHVQVANPVAELVFSYLLERNESSIKLNEIDE